jgi:transcriptional regulator with XRE-family HTH domain
MPVSQLSTFLRDARAKVDPASVAVARRGARRVPGLRREEVAELADMSDSWYARFEAGRARLSLPALARIAEVLGLRPDERAQLFALARPEITSDRTGRLAFESTGLYEMHIVQRLLRQLRDASTSDEVAIHTVRAVNECIRPTNTAYWVRQIDGAGNARFDHVDGPAAEGYAGLWQSAEASAHELAPLQANRRVVCESLPESPSEAYRERIEKFGARSYVSLGIGPIGKPWTAIGFANTTPGEFSPLAIATLDTIGEAARGALYVLESPASAVCG